jgi:hypothetical protein
VDVSDDLRPRERQHVVVAAQITPVGAQPLTAEAGLIELVLLDHGAHRTIEHDDALLERALEALDALSPLGRIDRLDGIGHRHGPCRGVGFVEIGACRSGPVGRMVAGAHAHTCLSA